MPKAMKLNSMRLLEARRIPYQALEYDPRIRDAEAVAESLGLPAGEVFKTLVVECPARKKPILALLPCHCTLGLKRLAQALGEKKLMMAKHKRAEELTGLKVGGISALALMHKRWDVCLDTRAMAVERIVVSAGKRGMQLRLARSDLVALLNCEIVDMADERLA